MTVNELIRKLTHYPGDWVVKSREKIGEGYTDISVFPCNKELLILGTGTYKDDIDLDECEEADPEKIYLV